MLPDIALRDTATQTDTGARLRTDICMKSQAEVHNNRKFVNQLEDPDHPALLAHLHAVVMPRVAGLLDPAVLANRCS